MRVALLPGHASKKEGASVCAGYYKDFGEYALAYRYLPALRDILNTRTRLTAVITNRESAGGTSPSYSAKAANAEKADVALEFHFNCADDESAAGCEVLYWGGSAKGKAFAEFLSDKIAKLLGVPDRGAKPISKPDDRGFSAFQKSRMPFFMVEPCFAGSNPDEARRFGDLIKNGRWSSSLASYISEGLIKVYDR